MFTADRSTTELPGNILDQDSSDNYYCQSIMIPHLLTGSYKL